MSLQPWMVAVAGVLVTMLALVFQEKVFKTPSSLGQYLKALSFNGLLSYVIALGLMQWNGIGPGRRTGGAPMQHLSAGGACTLPADVLSGPPHF